MEIGIGIIFQAWKGMRMLFSFKLPQNYTSST